MKLGGSARGMGRLCTLSGSPALRATAHILPMAHTAGREGSLTTCRIAALERGAAALRRAQCVNLLRARREGNARARPRDGRVSKDRSTNGINKRTLDRSK